MRVSVCSVGPAVDHSGIVSGVLVHVLSDQMSEVDEELRGFWNPVIRPGCEVELTHRACLCRFHLENKRHAKSKSKQIFNKH